MIRHVVMWKLRGPSSDEREQQATQLKRALENLRGRVPGMLALEVGISAHPPDEQVADVVLITTHETWEALEVYQDHPEHQKVAKLVSEIRTERRVVDFAVS